MQLHNLTKRATNIHLRLADETLAMMTLGRFAFSVSPTTSRTALRCLHNILYLVPSMRQVFVDHQYTKEVVVLIKVLTPNPL